MPLSYNLDKPFSNSIKRKPSNTENIKNEPLKKSRKLNSTVLTEINSDYHLDDDIDTFANTDFYHFLKKFALPSMMYKYLATRRSPFILMRNIFRQSSKCENNSMKQIVDDLSTLRFHDNNSYYKNRTKTVSKLSKYIIHFDRFLDGTTHKDWKTVDATLYLDIIYFIKDRRKNKQSVLVERLVSNRKLKCNSSNEETSRSCELDLEKIYTMIKKNRVEKAVLNFKILAHEAKFKLISEKTLKNIYPVTYEAMLPIYLKFDKFNDKTNIFSVKPGEYKLFLVITNMEKCDDSMFGSSNQSNQSTILKKEESSLDNFNELDNDTIESESQYGEIEDDVNRMLNSHWIEHSKENSNDTTTEVLQPRLLFTINCSGKQKAEVQRRITRHNSSFIPVRTSTNEQLDEISPCPQILTPISDGIDIVFAFEHNSKIVQWTKLSNIQCPWCHIEFNKYSSDSFLAFKFFYLHLTNWHFKFRFQCSSSLLLDRQHFDESLQHQMTNYGAVKFTVTSSIEPIVDLDDKIISLPSFEYLNESEYIGGSLGMVLGSRFDNNGKYIPQKRMPFSEIIYFKHLKPSLTPIHPDHPRQYYHSSTTEKLMAEEFEIDSESEECYSWLKQLYHNHTEEFLDINQSEKCVIELWNECMLNYGCYVSDAHIAGFVHHFISQITQNPSLLKRIKPFRNTLLMHLTNLVDFGVLPTSTFVTSMSNFDRATLSNQFHVRQQLNIC